MTQRYVGKHGDVGYSPPVWCKQHLCYCTDAETALHKFYAGRVDITVINLWTYSAVCQRCTNETDDKFAWPYYETFILGSGQPWQERGGYVPVCRCCHLELMAADALAP